MQLRQNIYRITTVSALIALLVSLQTGSVFAAALTTDVSLMALAEGGASRQFNLRLTPEPSDEVTTTFQTNGQCEIGPANQNFVVGGAVHTQNDLIHLAVRAIDDVEFESEQNCIVSFSATSLGDTNYSVAVKKQLSFAIADNDNPNAAGFTFSRLTISPMQEGDTIIETYSIKLLRTPNDEVYVTARADDQCDLLQTVGGNQVRAQQIDVDLGPSEVSANISLIPREDSNYEGAHQCVVSHTIASDDAYYQGLSAANYTTTIADNEVNPDIPDQRSFEGGLIYYKDANLDGIDDTEQANVKSFLHPVSGLRQAVMLTDENASLRGDCSFTEEPHIITANDPQLQGAVTTLGGITIGFTCTEETKPWLTWLIEQYTARASEWGMYRVTTVQQLEIVDSKHIVFDLGNDFTSALVTALGETSGSMSLVQTDSSPRVNLSRLDESQQSETAFQKVSGLVTPITLAGLTIASSLASYVLYRRFIKPVPSSRTIKPDIDRF